MQVSPHLKVMIEAAVAAGETLCGYLDQGVDLQRRAKASPADLVSIADEEAERVIIRHLAEAYPNYAVLGEESGASNLGQSDHTWVIDPLDGTMNFLCGSPLFGVSIGLARGEDLVAGVIHLPRLGETFWAESGQGAFLNGRKIAMSTRTTLSDAVLACGFPVPGKSGADDFLRQLALIVPKAGGMRRTGAASVDMAYVAAGRWDAYWEAVMGPWDLAAGAVLIREAGGVVTELTGGAATGRSQSVLAAAPALHATLSQIIRP
jgi:myo-inositol-1(or 4)-monophosphatase